MAFCRHDLTDKSLGHCQPLEILSTIASALLVVYLALGFLVYRGIVAKCFNRMLIKCRRRNWMMVKHISSVARFYK